MEEIIRESLDYDESTGEFYWKTRPQSHFKNRQSWSATNTKFAGKLAGVVRKIDGINYRFIKINQVTYGAHILAWMFHKGSLPKLYIDHIDGNGLNNNIDNLREVSASINSRNCKLYENSTTKICGVYWVERVKKWLAKGSIRVDGKKKNFHLGYHVNKEDAIKARKDWEISMGGFTERHGVASIEVV